ncbi:MAG: hypothetical protein ACI9OJ_002409, partial [Myxococcota bacterium]
MMTTESLFKTTSKTLFHVLTSTPTTRRRHCHDIDGS